MVQKRDSPLEIMDSPSTPFSDSKVISQGAEAKITLAEFFGNPCVIKTRFRKAYRVAPLDTTITQIRTRAEAKALVNLRNLGFETPKLYYADPFNATLWMEKVFGVTLKDFLLTSYKTSPENTKILMKLMVDSQTDPDTMKQLFPIISPKVKQVCLALGQLLAKMHLKGFVHGDLTTSNLLLRGVNAFGESENKDDITPIGDRIVIIDLGLVDTSLKCEDLAVDLYVLERALLSTHAFSRPLFDIIMESYFQYRSKHKSLLSSHLKNLWKTSKVDPMFTKFQEVRMRGRKRLAFG